MAKELHRTRGTEEPDDGEGRRARRRLPLVAARTGRRIEYDAARLAASIERARRVSRHGDASLSAEVADVVAYSLAAREAAAAEAGTVGQGVVDVDDLGALVERVLVELGYAAVAREYILARDRKARRREARRSDGPHGEGVGLTRLPAIRGREGTEPFDARRIAAALVEEADVDGSEAERVAAAVAGTLAGSTLRVVSTGLVRELVSNELLALGRTDALARHGVVGIPRHDLARLFESARAPLAESAPSPSARVQGRASERFEDLAAGTLLERWLLADVLSPEAAEAHRTGSLHVVGTDAPHRVVARSVPVDLLLNGPRWTRVRALGLASQVARIARDVDRLVVLEDLQVPVSSLISSSGERRAEREAPLVDLVVALGAVAIASDRDVAVARPGAEAAGPLLRALRTAVDEVGVSVQVFAALGEVEAAVGSDSETADAAEALLASGHLVPAWAPPGSDWAGPGLARTRGERGVLATGACVALNLPRLARRAGPWREDEMLRGLLEGVELAVDAIESIAALQARARSAHGSFASDRVVHAVVPAGLVDALGILGDGVARAPQGARLLGALADAVDRVGRERGVAVRVATRFADEASASLAAADARIAAAPAQPRLFSDLPRPEVALRAAYRSGFGALAGEATGDPFHGPDALAALLATVPLGTLSPGARDEALPTRADETPLRGVDSRTPAGGKPRRADGAERPWMAAWRRFEAERRTAPAAAPLPGEKSLF
ncbi:MAG: ATP cone domain-containing protein [Planctomycetota bacterium]